MMNWKKIWSDPVWSKVISWSLTGVFTVAGTYAWAHWGGPISSKAVVTNPAIEQPLAVEEKSGYGSYQDYKTHLDSLEGRFLERKDFIASERGKYAIWDGYVRNISDSKNEILVMLAANKVAKSSDYMTYFPENFRVKAFSLRQGDLVRVGGVIEIQPNGDIFLNSRSLELLSPAK